MIKKWKLLESKTVFESKFLTVVKEKLEKSDGELVSDFYSVRRSDAAFIVAVTEEGQIPLVYQYKNGVKDLIWQIPAGFIDRGERPEQAARRELAEETGFVADKFELFGCFSSHSSLSDNKDYFFFARSAKKQREQNLDQHEEIEVKLFDFEELTTNVRKRRSFFIDTQS